MYEYKGERPKIDGIHDEDWDEIFSRQPHMRAAGTLIGNFRTCPLPKCRRAKQCLGQHPVMEIATTHFKKFPPCVTDTPGQVALLAGMTEVWLRYIEEERRAGREVPREALED